MNPVCSSNSNERANSPVDLDQIENTEEALEATHEDHHTKNWNQKHRHHFERNQIHPNWHHTARHPPWLSPIICKLTEPNNEQQTEPRHHNKQHPPQTKSTPTKPNQINHFRLELGHRVNGSQGLSVFGVHSEADTDQQHERSCQKNRVESNPEIRD